MIQGIALINKPEGKNADEYVNDHEYRRGARHHFPKQRAAVGGAYTDNQNNCVSKHQSDHHEVAYPSLGIHGSASKYEE